MSAFRLVLDNSVTLGWFHPSQRTPYAEQVLDTMRIAEWMVPAHWPLELSNSLWQLERRKRIAREARLEALDEAAKLAIQVLPAAFDIHRISALAEQHGLTTYDAAYLDCTLRYRAQLATQDAALKKAASGLGCWFDTENL